VQGPGRAEPGDADAGLHPRLLPDIRLPRRPAELHEPREARRVRRHVHGRAREGRRDRLSRRHRQAAAAADLMKKLADLPSADQQPYRVWCFSCIYPSVCGCDCCCTLALPPLPLYYSIAAGAVVS
jgi:hypothetical protein